MNNVLPLKNFPLANIVLNKRFSPTNIFLPYQKFNIKHKYFCCTLSFVEERQASNELMRKEHPSIISNFAETDETNGDFWKLDY